MSPHPRLRFTKVAVAAGAATVFATACSSSDPATSAPTAVAITDVAPAASSPTTSSSVTTSTAAITAAAATTPVAAATTPPVPAGSSTAFVVSYTDAAPPGPVVCAEADQACVTNGLASALPTTGDWTGSVVSATGNATAGELEIGNGLIAFSGTVEPCGTGTVVLTVLTVRGPIVAPAPGATIAFEATPVEVVAGSGTGDLSGMTGSGTAAAVLTDTFGVDVTYTLDLECGGD